PANLGTPKPIPPASGRKRTGTVARPRASQKIEAFTELTLRPAPLYDEGVSGYHTKDGLFFFRSNKGDAAWPLQNWLASWNTIDLKSLQATRIPPWPPRSAIA